MELVIKLLTILSLGAIALWAAIPAGLALQIQPMAIGITAAIGAMLGALVVVLLGKRLRTWLAQRHGASEKKEPQKLWVNVALATTLPANSGNDSDRPS